MDVTLIYNPNAGGNGTASPDTIMQAFKEIGYDSAYPFTEDIDDLDKVLADPQGIIVAAGGDGTIRAVASRLVNTGAALVPLPMGTANNICTTLGVGGAADQIIPRLANPRKRAIDIGRVTSPWGTDYFLEAAGYGLFASVLDAYGPDKGKSIIRGIQSVRDTLSEYEAQHCRVTVDGEDLSGRYLLVEAFNTPALGPRIRLAPKADPADGHFDIVRIHEEARKELMSFLASLLNGEVDRMDSVEITQGTTMEILWDDFPIHLDALALPEMSNVMKEESRAPGDLSAQADDEDRLVRIDILPGAIEFWLPEETDQSG